LSTHEKITSARRRTPYPGRRFHRHGRDADVRVDFRHALCREHRWRAASDDRRCPDAEQDRSREVRGFDAIAIGNPQPLDADEREVLDHLVAKRTRADNERRNGRMLSRERSGSEAAVIS
jgi:hypothetical protein